MIKVLNTGYRAKSRFARFYNIPELMSMFKEIADIKTADQLNLPVPEAEYETVVLKPSEHQKDIVASLADRAETVRNGGVDSSIPYLQSFCSLEEKVPERVDVVVKVDGTGEKCMPGKQVPDKGDLKQGFSSVVGKSTEKKGKKSIHERLQINKEIIAKKQGKGNKEKGVELV